MAPISISPLAFPFFGVQYLTSKLPHGTSGHYVKANMGAMLLVTFVLYNRRFDSISLFIFKSLGPILNFQLVRCTSRFGEWLVPTIWMIKSIVFFCIAPPVLGMACDTWAVSKLRRLQRKKLGLRKSAATKQYGDKAGRSRFQGNRAALKATQIYPANFGKAVTLTCQCLTLFVFEKEKHMYG